ncbi:unnamed protein product, partial [Nesidiocoris tenuis]
MADGLYDVGFEKAIQKKYKNRNFPLPHEYTLGHLGSNLIGYSYVPYMGSVCPGTEVLLRFLPMHNEGPIAPSYVCPSAFMRMFFNRFLSGLYTKSGELTKIFNLASSSRFRCKLDLIRMNCRHWMLEIPVVRFCQAFSSEISEERYIIENWATMELLQMLRELRNRVLNDSRSFQLLNRLPFWGKLPTVVCRFASTRKPSERRLFPARSAVDFNYHYLRAVLAMAWIRSRQMGNVERPAIGSCVSHQRWPFPSLRRFCSCTFNKQAGDGQASNPYVTCRDLCEDMPCYNRLNSPTSSTIMVRKPLMQKSHSGKNVNFGRRSART